MNLKDLIFKQVEDPIGKLDRLSPDVIRSAYIDIHASRHIQQLFEFLISEYEKQISTKTDFTFNPMSTPNSWSHFLNRKFWEIGNLRARKNLLVHLIAKGKEFSESKKAEDWIDKH